MFNTLTIKGTHRSQRTPPLRPFYRTPLRRLLAPFRPLRLYALQLPQLNIPPAVLGRSSIPANFGTSGTSSLSRFACLAEKPKSSSSGFGKLFFERMKELRSSRTAQRWSGLVDSSAQAMLISTRARRKMRKTTLVAKKRTPRMDIPRGWGVR